MKISIIIPAYNEEKTILKVLESLEKVKFELSKEIILVDDGSTDKTKEKIEEYIKKNKNKDTEFKSISKKNEGKGSAVRKGIELSTGDIITIQDADLEYTPEELKKLIKVLLNNKSQVVYGSRFMKKHKPLYKVYYLGNNFLTFLTKVLYGSNITDMETCYKMFKRETLKNLKLKSKALKYIISI